MPRMPQLEQHQLDLIGLGLVALAAFFTFVFYLGWDGGKLGGYMADGFIYLFGGVAYLAPIALFGTGAVLVLRPMLPSVKPFKAGAGCILVGAHARPGGAARSASGRPCPSAWATSTPPTSANTAAWSARPLYWVTHTLFQQFGTDIFFLFLMMGGALLLTGASVAGIVRATSESLTSTTRRVKQSTSEFAAIVTGRPASESEPLAQPPLSHQEPIDEGPPEVEPVVRATHVEAPALDGERRYPDLYGHDEDEDQTIDQPAEDEAELEDDVAAGVAAVKQPRPPQQDELTPQGNRRSAVTEADDLEYKAPADDPAEALERCRQGRHERPGAHGRAARGGARALRGGVAGGRDRRRPARDPLRAAAGARHQDVQGQRPQGRPRLRAGRRRTCASSRRSPASRRWAWRCRTRCAASSTSATSSRTRPRAGRRSPSGWARTSPARRSAPTSPSSRTCSWRARPARASRAA